MPLKPNKVIFDANFFRNAFLENTVGKKSTGTQWCDNSYPPYESNNNE